MEKTATQWMVEPLRKYATFSGRARRAEYWWFILLCILLTAAAGIIDYAIGSGRNGPVGGIMSLALLLPQLAVSVRRLHDGDRSGWWMLVPVVLGCLVAFFAFGGFLSAISDSSDPAETAKGNGMIAGLLISGLGLLAVEILFLVWFCSRGTVGDNRFGPDPLAGQGASTF